MASIINIHPENPQQRLVKQVVRVLEQGGVVIYPTETGYALGCIPGSKDAIDRIRQIRDLDKHHHFTLCCRDLSELSTYARVNNPTYRLLKAHTPGPYTFILMATRQVPRRLQHPNRRTIGIRVTQHVVAHAILEALDRPMLSVSLLAADDESLTSSMDVLDKMERDVDVMVVGGYCESSPSTIVDLTEGHPIVLRVGAGDPAPFEV